LPLPQVVLRMDERKASSQIRSPALQRGGRGDEKEGPFPNERYENLRGERERVEKRPKRGLVDSSYLHREKGAEGLVHDRKLASKKGGRRYYEKGGCAEETWTLSL